MDIKLKQSKISKKKWLAGSGILLSLCYAVYAQIATQTPSVKLSELTFETAQQGDIDLYVEAYGHLQSAKERLITAPAQGIVSELVVRPGAQVQADTIVLRLSNPKLLQALNQAKSIYAQEEAKLAAFEYQQQSSQLDNQTRIADIQAKLEEAELELSINQQLMKRGVAAKIEIQRAKLNLKQQKRRLALEQEKYQQLKEMAHFQLAQRKILLEQHAAKVAMINNQYQSMAVKAGIKGRLQLMQVALGQSVQLGESLAKVGSDKQLIAKLKIPQNRADQIDIGSPVTIDTQKGLIKAKISRIESLIDKGTILAEATLHSSLSSNARPALPITSKIFVNRLQDALFIKQIPGLRPHSTQKVFVRNQSDRAMTKEITTGELSENWLLVLHGLEAGEQIISSNTDTFNQAEKITITQ